MGLITPVELPSVEELGAVHFIAIGGSGMNGIAAMMLAQGIRVSGSDRQDSKYLRSLEAQGTRVYVGHRAEQLGDAATVVVSSAIREDNPELAEARRRGLRVLHRSAALGSLMLGRRGIAVAGTHGKTTTTAMIAHVLSGCGFDPSFVIGGALTGTATGGTPFEVEMKLNEVVPPKYRLHAHHWLILHGRYVCLARRPLCERCVIADLCKWPGKTIVAGAA